eukprot:11004075-Lingulodinium_polyedra.AAC.1
MRRVRVNVQTGRIGVARAASAPPRDALDGALEATVGSGLRPENRVADCSCDRPAGELWLFTPAPLGRAAEPLVAIRAPAFLQHALRRQKPGE